MELLRVSGYFYLFPAMALTAWSPGTYDHERLSFAVPLFTLFSADSTIGYIITFKSLYVADLSQILSR